MTDHSRRLNFHFSTLSLLLIMSLVGVMLSWFKDRQRYTEREASARKVFVRWGYAETAARTELAWNSLKDLEPELKVNEFDKRMRGSLFWMIDEAFSLEESLDNVFGRSGYTCEQVYEMISRTTDDSLNSPSKLLSRLKEFYELDVRSKEHFPHLFETESEDFTKFYRFLCRVFEQEGVQSKMPGAK